MSFTGLLMDVKKFAVHDGPGIRTTLFLKGCTLKCVWCHNPEGICAKAQMAYYAHKCINCMECARVCSTGAHAIINGKHAFARELCVCCAKCEEACLGEAMKRFGRVIDVDEGVKLIMEDKPFYDQSGGGATISGGEPLMQAEYARALMTELKQLGVHTAVDTCGNVAWDAFERVLPVTDMFLYDIKHIDSDAHRLLTGAGNERIIDNLARLSASGARIEIRIPLVPGANSDDDTMTGIGRLLGSLNIERVKVLPYHSMARSKYLALGMQDTMPDADSPTDGEIARAVNILKEYGVNAVSGRA